MTPTQRKYLNERLTSIAAQKKIEIIENFNAVVQEQINASKITLQQLMEYLADSPKFKGQPEDFLPHYVADLFDADDIRNTLNIPLMPKYKSINVRIPSIATLVGTYEEVFPLLKPIDLALQQAIDTVMIGDSASAQAALDKFTDLQF